MAANILAFVQFDDNTPRDQAPFTNDASLWSMEWDYGLLGCKDYDFIAAISGLRDKRGGGPLIKLRGCPPGDFPVFEKLRDEDFVGYLRYAELLDCINYYGLSLDKLHSSVQNVFGVLSTLSQKYGDDRVRFVFAILL